MLLTLCKSKITPATVTQTELWYEGSITVDADLIEAAGLVPYEQVHVLNINNGERIITYVIEGTRGSGIICLNGPSARAAVVGDRRVGPVGGQRQALGQLCQRILPVGQLRGDAAVRVV